MTAKYITLPAGNKRTTRRAPILEQKMTGPARPENSSAKHRRAPPIIPISTEWDSQTYC